MTRTATADRYALARYNLHNAERSFNHEIERHYERPCSLSRKTVIICCRALKRERAAYAPAWAAYCASVATLPSVRVMERVG